MKKVTLLDRVLYGFGAIGGIFMLYVLIHLDTNIAHKIIGIPIMLLFSLGCWVITTYREEL